MFDRNLRLGFPKENSRFCLDGEWQFAYRASADPVDLALPEEREFSASMIVPGYWDDHWDLLKEMERVDFWSEPKFNPNYRPPDFPLGNNPPDASLQYLLGFGWYRRRIAVPSEWSSKFVTLHVGGVIMDAWVWVNRKLLKHHASHSTPFSVPLEKSLTYGSENELVIAVSNVRADRLGCSIRGYSGRSAGIRASVVLNASNVCRTPDLHVWPSDDLSRLNWRLQIPPGRMPGALRINYAVVDPATGEHVISGKMECAGDSAEWTSSSEGLAAWSDDAPRLYRAELEISNGDGARDIFSQPFGMRHINREGFSIRLNGTRKYLRGATEHAYFAKTCTPPISTSYYLHTIGKLKSLGFNWLRFHTWVPPEEYLDAADQLGMLIQIEAPRYSSLEEWADIVRFCRKHPSVVIYCAGNEEILDDAKIAELRALSELIRKEAPDALFNPQEAMRGVEYYWTPENMGADAVMEPYPHNPRRLEELKSFSDVFGSYSWGMLSYSSAAGDPRIIDDRLVPYERPCLSHEICIHGSFINLDLEHRYEGTRIGPGIFAAARKNLREAGLLGNAALYFANSCAWMRDLRKHAFENARKCSRLAGYDMLAAIDHHWHRTGYDCGIMNEFYEMKPGELPEDVLRYNGETVLLLDHGNMRNYWEGAKFRSQLRCSHFGPEEMRNCRLMWRLSKGDGNIFASGEWAVPLIPAGEIQDIGELSFNISGNRHPVKATLSVSLQGSGKFVDNKWDFWIFPQPSPVAAEADGPAIARFSGLFQGLSPVAASAKACAVRLLSGLDRSSLDWIRKGGSAVVLGAGAMPSSPANFQICVAGRPKGHAATVIWDHPVMREFPHDGYCGWQFHDMLTGSSVVSMDYGGTEFDPIIELMSSYKRVRRHSALFEGILGKGRVMVCTLNMSAEDPASMYLLYLLLRHAQDREFRPQSRLPADFLLGAGSGEVKPEDMSTDQALDPNARLV